MIYTSQSLDKQLVQIDSAEVKAMLSRKSGIVPVMVRLMFSIYTEVNKLADDYNSLTKMEEEFNTLWNDDDMLLRVIHKKTPSIKKTLNVLYKFYGSMNQVTKALLMVEDIISKSYDDADAFFDSLAGLQSHYNRVENLKYCLTRLAKVKRVEDKAAAETLESFLKLFSKELSLFDKTSPAITTQLAECIRALPL